MFFDAIDTIPRKSARLRELPPIPETGWKPPQYFPDLSDAAVIAFDTETKEKDFEHGPGWARGKSDLIGVSVAARDRRGATGKWYFPLGHEVEAEWNIERGNCLGWLKRTLETPNIPKIGANLIFDVGTLVSTAGIFVQGPLFDVQFAEALLDETARVGLDSLARKYLGEGKVTGDLYAWLASAYGGDAGPKQRSNIWRAPPRLVGPYAEADADQPLHILEKQWPLLEGEGLVKLFDMECRSIPLLVKMRLAGVTIDIDRAEQMFGSLGRDIEQLENQMREVCGLSLNVNSGRDLARGFDALGLPYLRTADGNPSFEKEWLKGCEHPFAQLVNAVREHKKIRDTFVRSYLLESHVPTGPGRGKVHCEFHPLKNDEGGTKTGRFSSSSPNLQNIPARTKLGKRVREAFIPDPGHLTWEKDDYSQIEYRMLAHFAGGETQHERASAEALRQSYRDNPKTDYHDKVYGMVCPLMGWDFNDPNKELRDMRRKPIKNVNFGLLYGQSEKELAYKAGFTDAQAREFFTAYHTAAPYCRSTMKMISSEVQRLGYVTTILGRRTRFDLWEPAGNKKRETPLPLYAARARWGALIKRAYDYRGTNYKFQGSAADVIKAAMVRAYSDGVFDVIGVPRLQVHDELDFSVIDDSPAQREGFAHLHWLLENATPCNVPVKVDCERGAHWGAVA